MLGAADSFEPVGSTAHWTMLFDLYVLGDVFQDQEFCNAVLNGIFETSNEGSSWPGFLAKKACAQLPESSPLRSLLIDVWVGAGEQSYETDSGDLLHGPREFWVQVSKRQARAIRSGVSVQNFSSIKHRCDYHYHKEGDKCEGAAV